MGVVGSRIAMLVMREAYYGTTRFDDFATRVGITEAATASRLRELVEAGVLAKQPYREPGQRTRHEYVLTEAGRELLPVVVGLWEWGRKHTANRSRLQMVHAGCGAEAHAVVRCTSGHEVLLEDLAVRVAPRRVE